MSTTLPLSRQARRLLVVMPRGEWLTTGQVQELVPWMGNLVAVLSAMYTKRLIERGELAVIDGHVKRTWRAP